MRGLQYSKALLRNSRIANRAVASPTDAAALGLFRFHPRLLQGQLARDAGLTHSCARCFSQTTWQAKNASKERTKGRPDVTTAPKAAAAPKSKNTKPGAGAGTGNEEVTSGGDGRPKPNPEEPFDLSDLEFGWARGAEHFEDQLKKMRAGGRFNPDAIGAVRVRPDKKSAETFPLHELAAVVPKGGRNIGVLVHEAAYIKPVMSAIQASPDFNQQPQRSEENELELILKVEPERKEGLVKRAKELCHAWREQVRAERHKRDVVVKRWHKDGLLTANDKTRLEKELQKLQDKRMAHVDSKEKEILQHIAAKEGR